MNIASRRRPKVSQEEFLLEFLGGTIFLYSDPQATSRQLESVRGNKEQTIPHTMKEADSEWNSRLERLTVSEYYK